jgi:predicted ATPase/DNA-binding SARP family transcriptional activator/DNA-binding CsgD family transcriptional regulator
MPIVAGEHAMNEPLPDVPETLRITLLGTFRVTVADRPIPDSAWRQRKATALIKLLALAPGQVLHREQLLDLLWPELPPAAAAHNLRYALHMARNILEGPPAHLPRALHLIEDRLVLRPEGALAIDAAAFNDAATIAQRGDDPATYAAAIALYHGELLPADRYEDWASLHRETLRERYLALLRRYAALSNERGDTANAIGAYETLVQHEPTDEDAHTALMRLYAANGQRVRALRQYGRLRNSLQHDLGIEPEAASQRLYTALLAGGRATPDDADSMASHPDPAHNLPAPTTSFIGREQERASLGRLIAAAEQRLITLLGIGGSGKTRLAIELARAQFATGTFPDGIWFVSLATTTSRDLVAVTIARTLGISDQPIQDPVAGIVARLGTSTALLVLDNCEHLVDVCAEIAQAILAACPRVQILATSREALHIPGERAWPVAGLSLPPRQQAAQPSPPSVTLLHESEAARLFCERAAFSQTGFTLTTDNAAAIAAICHQLDGIPLALELAAARCALLTPEQLALRLDNALSVLTNGARTAPSRQRTLRATLDWSHTLLDPAERALFRRLAPFAGGWTIEAAEALGADEGLLAAVVLDLLAQLVDRSLVVVDTTQAVARYRLLEIVRQYANERLAESGEGATIVARHAAYFLALAEEAEPHLNTHRQDVWLQRLDNEQPNFRAALQTMHHAGNRAATLRLLSALWWFWYLRGHYQEGQGLLLAALDAPDSATATSSGVDGAERTAQAKVLLGACVLTWRSGDYPFARRLGERGLTLYRELGNQRGMAWTLIFLSHVCGPLHDDVAGPAYIAEALRLFRACGDDVGLARTLNALGETARQIGDYNRAEALFNECLALDHAAGNTSGRALRLMNLGFVMARQGRTERAAALLAESLALSRKIGNMLLVANCLDGFAIVAAEYGQPTLAAQLFGAADALLAALDTTREGDPPQHTDYLHYKARVLTALGAPTADAARADGRGLSQDAAIALIARLTGMISEQATVSGTAAPPPKTVLGRREHEVAVLVASGCTNAEIARELGMSKRTVDTHVGHILQKLGVTSRAAVGARLAVLAWTRPRDSSS